MTASTDVSWFEGGFFSYPPRYSWRKAASEKVRKAWGSAFREPPGPMGLYIHLPPELACVPRFELDHGLHPYLRCLANEANLLGVPSKARFTDLYIGGEGRGALAALEPRTLADLLQWLFGRFGLDFLEQFTVEADASMLDEEKVSLLAGRGADRLTASFPPGRKEEFARGVRLAREAGIRVLDIDASGAAAGDLDSIRELEPDSVNLPLGADAPPSSGDGRPKNRQLARARELAGAVLGLGAGAVSYAGRGMVYAKTGGFTASVRSLLAGELPELAGGPVTEEQAMRGRLISGFWEDGFVDRAAFSETFGRPPEEAFPAVFETLEKDGRLVREGERFLAAAREDAGRMGCARAFAEEEYPFHTPARKEPAGEEPPSDEAKRLLAEAIGEFQKGDFDDAVITLDRCLKASPGYTDALMTRSAIHARRQDYEAVKRDLDSLVRAQRGRVDAGTEPWESRASAPARRVLADALSSRSESQLRAGDLKKAFNDLEEALLTAPEDWTLARRTAALLDAMHEKRGGMKG